MNIYEYDYEKRERVVKEEVNLHAVARCMELEDMTELLDHYCNGRGGYFQGVKIGKLLHRSHRFIQGQIIMTLIGILAGMSEQTSWDARNEDELRRARIVREQAGLL